MSEFGATKAEIIEAIHAGANRADVARLEGSVWRLFDRVNAMPPRLSPELIAQLNKLASRLTAQGEYEAVDLIDTVVERVTAMPQRELLREALEALSGVIRVADRKTVEFDAARAAADKIRAALTQEKQT
jgi:hypothetical protein